jgi:chromate reductase
MVGSLRKASRNRALLDAAVDLAPEGMSVEPYGIGDLPFYDGDVESQGDPEPVLTFNRRSWTPTACSS